MQITVDDICARWVNILSRFWEDRIVPSDLIAIKMGFYLVDARLSTAENMYHPLIIEIDTQEKCRWLRSVGAEAAVYLAIQNEFGCKWGGHIVIMNREVQDDDTSSVKSITEMLGGFTFGVKLQSEEDSGPTFCISLNDIRTSWKNIINRIVSTTSFVYLCGVTLETRELTPLPQDSGKTAQVLLVFVSSQERYDWLQAHDAEEALRIAIMHEFGCPWDGPIEIVCRSHTAFVDPVPAVLRQAQGIVELLGF
jgi:hypothetical protein